MKKKSLLTLDDEFMKYCELNNITDTESLAKKIFQRGFTIEKYGETPSMAKGKEKIIEKEVIKEIKVEVIKEVPVEKIVEVIKEIPVEKIVEVVKEVPVEVKGETKAYLSDVGIYHSTCFNPKNSAINLFPSLYRDWETDRKSVV